MDAGGAPDPPGGRAYPYEDIFGAYRASSNSTGTSVWSSVSPPPRRGSAGSRREQVVAAAVGTPAGGGSLSYSHHGASGRGHSIGDVLQSIYQCVGPHLPHTLAPKVYDELSAIMEQVQRQQMQLDAAAHTAKAKLQREVSIRQREQQAWLDKLEGSRLAAQVADDKLAEALADKARAEKRCASLEAQVKQLSNRVAELSEAEDGRIAALAAVDQLKTRHREALHGLKKELEGKHREELRIAREEMAASSAGDLSRTRREGEENVRNLQQAAQAEVIEMAELIGAMQRRIEELEVQLDESLAERAKVGIECEKLRQTSLSLSVPLMARSTHAWEGSFSSAGDANGHAPATAEKQRLREVSVSVVREKAGGVVASEEDHSATRRLTLDELLLTFNGSKTHTLS
jgi:hypothetical protein